MNATKPVAMNLSAHRLISLGAMVALTGYILSGPAGFLLVRSVQPQPAWESAATFARYYHVVQDVPYYFGLLLIGGMLMLAAGHCLLARDEPHEVRFHALLSLAWTTAFAALIFFNYLVQTTYVRHLALAYEPAHDTAITIFSMANPRSLAWATEMWGYGILGVATWLLAGYYRGRSRPIRLLLIANGIVSILTVVFTVIDISWVLTPFGLAGYFVWNALMIALMALLWRYYHVREAAVAPAL
jgi:hypothetical protein